MRVKPIFPELNAEDMTSIKNEIMELANTISESGIAKKLVEAVTKLIDTVMVTANSSARKKGPEIFGGSSFRKKQFEEFKTLPTRFSPVYYSIDKKYML